MNRHSVDIVCARRRSDNSRVHSTLAKLQRKVAQVKLNAAHAWQEPVADEGDAHV
jgi:hypothetical protein